MNWNKLLRGAVPALLTLSLLTACGPAGPAFPNGDSSRADSAAQGTVSSTPTGLEIPFVFTRDNLPRLDGSTSTVPLAKALCAVLLGESREDVADLVQFSRTTQSYRNLMAGEADLVLAAEPTPEVRAELEAGDQWLLTPFATDALVFVVNRDKIGRAHV